jgi:hypothetical protein
MPGPWFRAKRYGWGWYPATWQGWLVIFGFISAVVLNFLRLDAQSHSVHDTMRPFLVETAAMSIVLILIGYLTGERPRWRWGNRDADGRG